MTISDETHEVGLQVRACHASKKNQRHDPHMYHVMRRAVDAITAETACMFYAYFWCNGVTAAQSEVTPTGDA